MLFEFVFIKDYKFCQLKGDTFEATFISIVTCLHMCIIYMYEVGMD